MRPAGEVRQALLRAAVQLATPDRGPTMRELASAACVGYSVARRTVDHMKRSGELRVARERKVDYRNRPVLVVVLGSSDRQQSFNDATAAAKWVWTNYRWAKT